MSMNNHSIIKIITLFFGFIFILINALFWIAKEHFLQERLSDRVERFELAHRLLHHPSGDFDSDLKQLFVALSKLPSALIQNEGKKIAQFRFAKIIEYKQRVYFIKLPPPPPPFVGGFLPPLPPPPRFDDLVLEDLKEIFYF